MKNGRTYRKKRCTACQREFKRCYRFFLCPFCRSNPQHAMLELISRINGLAEAEMLAGRPVTGAHHRSIEKVLSEMK